jgi:hypothetical protein
MRLTTHDRIFKVTHTKCFKFFVRTAAIPVEISAENHLLGFINCIDIDEYHLLGDDTVWLL